ncbi:amino-acid permease BAT1 isoform X1 [Carex littledalei]|uniref:Amino-acid permease BAT1 isoform X1 n=1 Tax=Carex littledalei TaxID=544730 RepID=A0A833VFH1_9POAL|nr:amino-acid permease BAT1 isoform X1 [Carex littledalei]
MLFWRKSQVKRILAEDSNTHSPVEDWGVYPAALGSGDDLVQFCVQERNALINLNRDFCPFLHCIFHYVDWYARAQRNWDLRAEQSFADFSRFSSAFSLLSCFAMATEEVMDSGEKRLNELGYKQELRREMTLFKTLAISFSTMTLFTGITPLFGSSLLYAGPASLVWGWVVVTFFTWFVGIAMAEICSSFPTTGSLYFWAAHLAGPKWGPFASWCCAWLESIGLIFGIGTQAYAGTQTLQSIILLCTGTNKGGGYYTPRGVFLAIYIGLTLIWAFLNTFALEVIAFLDVISLYWQVIGGTVIVVMLPLVAKTTQSASFVFTHFETGTDSTGISSKAYAVILSFLVSQYSLYGYDAAAHLTEETKGADKNGPIAILSSIGIISVFGWAYILALTFSIQDLSYLYDPSNETAGSNAVAQILYDAFHGRYHNSAGAIVLLFIIWGSFFFGGLSITTSAARVVYALSRDKGVPFSSIWRKIHPKHKVPSNAVWLCAGICILIGIPLLKVNEIFTAITSVCTIGWVGGYAVPIFARMIMPEKNFNPGPLYLGKLSRPVCLVAFLWICYTCSVFLLPTVYPITWSSFNYAPVALGLVLGLIMLWWILDARKWFKGPVRNIDNHNGKV